MKKRLVQQLKDYVKTFIRPDNLIVYPELVDKPAGSRVVVFSPHFDDDVIGCGGTLLKHVLAGDSVHINSVKAMLAGRGVRHSLLSGSGPTVFCTFENKKDAEDVFKNIPKKKGRAVFLVKTYR